MVKGVLLGLALGLAVGWLVFDREPGIVPETVVVERDGDPDTPLGLESIPAPLPFDAEEAAAASEPRFPEAEVMDVIRRGSWPELEQVIGAAEDVPDAVVRALIDRAEAAFASGHEAEFMNVITVLGRIGRATVDAYLVTLVRLVQPEWPGDFEHQGRWLSNAFGERDVAGAGSAIRERIEAHLRAQAGHRPTYAWRRLVLRHGSEADVAWLIDLDGSPFPVCRVAVNEGLETARHYLELAAAEAAHAPPGERGSMLNVLMSFTSTHPHEGAPLVAEALRTGELFGIAYHPTAASLLANALEQTVGVLPSREIEATVAAIPDLERRLYVTWSLIRVLPTNSALLAEPIELIQDAVHAGDLDLGARPDLGAACSVLRQFGYPLSEEAVEAVEALAAIAGEGERADFVRESAAVMRARLEQRWK